MKLRSANINDIADISNIHALSWRDTYGDVLTQDYLDNLVSEEREKVWWERLYNPKTNQYVVVAESEQEIVGFACAYLDENIDWGSCLDNLHVRKSYQAQGIGKYLLFNVAHYCYQNALQKRMCLTVNQDNIQAQKFYLKHGARNAREDVWSAPDGSVVPTYWFVWEELGALAKNN